MVLHALDAGYALQPPCASWHSQPQGVSRLDAAFIAALSERGFTKHTIAELNMSFAVHAKDLRLLKRAIQCSRQRPSKGAFREHPYVLELALRVGWVEGARLLLRKRYRLKQPFHCVVEAALEGASLDCLNFLLGLGREWRAVAFSVAASEGRFTGLEHVVERGLGRCPGTLVSRLPSPGECGLDFPTWISIAASHAQLRQSAQRGQKALAPHVHTRWSTVEGHLMAVVHAAVAGGLACEVQCLREPARLLLLWWHRESRLLPKEPEVAPPRASPT